MSTAAAEGERGGAVTERFAARVDNDGLPELGMADARRWTALFEVACWA